MTFSLVKRHKQRGFSLIELLVVISIIGLIIAAGTVSWKNAQIKSRDSKRKADLKTVQEALERFYTVYGKYPPENPDANLEGNIGCFETGSSPSWGSMFRCYANIYLNSLPQDPIAKGNYIYFYCSNDAACSFSDGSSTTNNDQSYILAANLENTNDPDITPLGCNLDGYQFNYCLTNP